MRKLRLDIEREAVQRHPALDANADGRDLVLESVALVRPPHPYPDAVVAPLAAHIEGGQRADDPFFDGGDEAAHVRRAALEIEHDIADPLAGAVIGELAAASGGVDRKARVDQLLRPRRGAGGVERRVLEEPDQLARFAARDCFDARVHGGERSVVADAFVAHAPFDRRRAGWRQKPDRQVGARVNHLVTMAWP